MGAVFFLSLPPQPPSADTAVYLLHYPNKLHRTRHYVGSCHAHRLAHRLNDHATGQASNLTTALAEINTHFLLADVWWTEGRSFEKRLKKTGHLNRRCFCCQFGLEGAPLATCLIHETSPDVAALRRDLLAFSWAQKLW